MNILVHSSSAHGLISLTAQCVSITFYLRRVLTIDYRGFGDSSQIRKGRHIKVFFREEVVYLAGGGVNPPPLKMQPEIKEYAKIFWENFARVSVKNDFLKY